MKFKPGDLITLNPVMFPYEDAIEWLGIIIAVEGQQPFTCAEVMWLRPRTGVMPEHVDYLTLVSQGDETAV